MDITEKKNLEEIEAEIERLENAPANEDDSALLVEKIGEYNARSPWIRTLAIVTTIIVLIAFYISYDIFIANSAFTSRLLIFIGEVFNSGLIKFILVGIGAQVVDGALGMAYGATCSSFLLSLGLTPAMASASVHIAEIFTTGSSGLSHLRFGNVNKKLFFYLVFPGCIGAAVGAYLLSDVIDGNIIKPFIALYLLILGVIILRKAFVARGVKKKTKNVGILAAFGGLMDSMGGGGWGPIVTSTLLGKGRAANYTIGSVNLAEFFIALAGGGTFLIFTGINGWQAIIGLIIGGVVASPFAAFLVSRVKRKPIMILVGLLIITLSIRTFYTAKFGDIIHLIENFKN